MSNSIINVDPREREKFANKLVDYEDQMRATVQMVKSRLEDAEGYLKDPGSQFYIAEARILMEMIESLLDGGITEIGNVHAKKARAQIEIMEEFEGRMNR